MSRSKRLTGTRRPTATIRGCGSLAPHRARNAGRSRAAPRAPGPARKPRRSTISSLEDSDSVTIGVDRYERRGDALLEDAPEPRPAGARAPSATSPRARGAGRRGGAGGSTAGRGTACRSRSRPGRPPCRSGPRTRRRPCGRRPRSARPAGSRGSPGGGSRARHRRPCEVHRRTSIPAAAQRVRTSCGVQLGAAGLGVVEIAPGHDVDPAHVGGGHHGGRAPWQLASSSPSASKASRRSRGRSTPDANTSAPTSLALMRSATVPRLVVRPSPGANGPH